MGHLDLGKVLVGVYFARGFLPLLAGPGERLSCTAVTTVNQHVPWVTRYLYVVLGPNFAFAVHHFHLCSRPEWAQVAPARLEVGLARWAAPRHLELPIHDSS